LSSFDIIFTTFSSEVVQIIRGIYVWRFLNLNNAYGQLTEYFTLHDKETRIEIVGHAMDILRYMKNNHA
jgi:hypothetical protein